MIKGGFLYNLNDLLLILSFDTYLSYDWLFNSLAFFALLSLTFLQLCCSLHLFLTVSLMPISLPIVLCLSLVSRCPRYPSTTWFMLAHWSFSLAKSRPSFLAVFTTPSPLHIPLFLAFALAAPVSRQYSRVNVYSNNADNSTRDRLQFFFLYCLNNHASLSFARYLSVFRYSSRHRWARLLHSS